LSSGATVIMDLDATNDLNDVLSTVGSLDLGGATLVVNLTGAAPTTGTTFPIISAGSLTGTFAGLPNGAQLYTTNGVKLTINYGPTSVWLTQASFSVGSVVVDAGAGNLVNEEQSLTVAGSVSSFQVTYDGVASGTITPSMTAAQVKTALQQIAALNGNIVVTGSVGGPYDVTFDNNLAGLQTDPLTVVHTVGSGTVTEAEVTMGNGDVLGMSTGTNPLYQAGRQHSLVTQIVVSFNSPIDTNNSSTNLADAFVLENTSNSDATVNGTVNLNVSLNSAKTVATITFSGGDAFTRSRTGGDALADGDYLFKINQNDLYGSSGTQLTAGVADDFFTQYGDVNGDRWTNNLDFVQFRQSYGSAAGNALYRDYLDYDGDGNINGTDYTAFQARLGMYLKP
jgi:hypothetical protein